MNGTGNIEWFVSGTTSAAPSPSETIEETFGKYPAGEFDPPLTKSLVEGRWREVAEEMTAEQCLVEAAHLIERASSLLSLAGYQWWGKA